LLRFEFTNSTQEGKKKVFITIYKLKEKRREEGSWLGKMTN